MVKTTAETVKFANGPPGLYNSDQSAISANAQLHGDFWLVDSVIPSLMVHLYASKLNNHRLKGGGLVGD